MLNKDKLNALLTEYKSDFSAQWEKENYKRIAIKHFQDNWDIDAKNFHEMLKNSLKKTGNLLLSKRFFPGGMIQDFAERYPEQVRKMFRNLFDETKDVSERIENFKQAADKLLEKYQQKENADNHYQTANSISTYLWLHNPDKYYIYKFSEYKNVVDALDAEYKVSWGQSIDNLISCFALYDEVCKIIKQDTELADLVRTHTDNQHYKDKKFKITTVDFCFFVSRKKDTGEVMAKTNNVTSQTNHWWLTANPSIWKFSDIIIGSEQYYTLLNSNGNPRRIPQNFRDAKADDLIIGYEASPKKMITALCKVTKKDKEKLYFTKIKDFVNPVDYQTLKAMPELADLEFFKNPNGSLFKVTEMEYNAIMDLIDDGNAQPNLLNSVTSFDKYTKKEFLRDVFMSSEKYDELVDLLKTKKNIILQGAPGVGKTYAAERLAYSIMGSKDKSRVKFIQFHQNYSYEDFVIGYKPTDTGFELKRGVFYEFCMKAANDPSQDYFFIIDEINRGNMSKIFGELLMMIESDYRNKPVQLAYTKDSFIVPENLHIIGMMNTADRSLAMIDYALRRRFSFVNMEPGFNTAGFKKYLEQNPKFKALTAKIVELNAKITADASLGKGFCIGHSYLCKPDSDIKSIIKYDLIPLIEEYWFDNETIQKQHITFLEELVK